MQNLKNERGQGLIEYLLLVCLVAATTIGVLSVLGTNIKQQYQKASAAIRGEKTDSVHFTTPGAEQTKARGMGDWERGAERVE